MTTPVLNEAAVVAQLLVETLRSAQGLTGVLVQDVPYLDPQTVLTELEGLQAEGVELRVAYLSSRAEAVVASMDLSESLVSTRVEDAERWRNTADLTAL